MSRTPCSLSCSRFAPAPSNCSTTRANWIDCSRSVPIRPANERRGFSGTWTTEWGLYAEGERIFQRGSVGGGSAGKRGPGGGGVGVIKGTQRGVERVKLRHRRLKSGWEDARGGGTVVPTTDVGAYRDPRAGMDSDDGRLQASGGPFCGCD